MSARAGGLGQCHGYFEQVLEVCGVCHLPDFRQPAPGRRARRPQARSAVAPCHQTAAGTRSQLCGRCDAPTGL
eukprot:gene83-biopygen3040